MSATGREVLSVVMHKLRDRLPVELSAHLGAEMPLLVRGVYYDQFEPAKQPTDCDFEEFVAEVEEWLSDTRPVNPKDAIRAVFGVLSRHIPRGQIARCNAPCRRTCVHFGSQPRRALLLRPSAATRDH